VTTGDPDRRKPPVIAFFMHLPGDIEAIGPIAEAASASEECSPVLMAHPYLFQQKPRALEILKRIGPPVVVVEDGAEPAAWLSRAEDTRACIFSAETTLRPHKRAHELAIAANAAGVSTFVGQHGIENVGITFFDAVQGTDVRFASRHVLTWMPMERLPPETPTETREKMQVVGRPAWKDPGRFDLASWPLGDERIDVAIFENIHWHRYSEIYRQSFVRDVVELAAGFPDRRILIKPHPQGRWLTQRYKGEKPSAKNLVIADPTSPEWSDISAHQIISRSELVVTTPSTVALDGAQAGRPTAVFAYDIEARLYEPLPLIRKFSDLEALVTGESSKAKLLDLARQYVEVMLRSQTDPRTALSAILKVVEANEAR
jgi:hypothetical protein